ncbi:MAG: hypothetical protein KGD68_08975 [Candidatus Lokiarchaeota archaeon]|nr:hypothetical protein [Candidatus Lokiarchaeota archaeon]
MLFTFLQMNGSSIGELIPFIMMGVLAAADILLLKLALVITNAQKKTRMKWVAGSFLIQFGIIFIISSPLFLLSFMGSFHGDADVIIPIVILSVFIDLNVINVLHQVGLKRSFVILLITIVPIIMVMIGLGSLLSQMP